MGLVEYLAVLVSPSPKDTIKAIESRRKDAAAKKKAFENADSQEVGVEIDASSGIFKNTSFYDTIAAEANEESANALKNFFNDTNDKSSNQMVKYKAKPGQMDYFNKAIEAHQKGEDLVEPPKSLQGQIAQMHLDAIQF